MALNPIWAQSSSPVPADSAPDGALHIHVVDDPGPAQPQSTSVKGYVLQVTNTSGAPVAGAAVALRLPEDGPTGRFANGLRAWVAYSDPAGIARFPVIQWGETGGPVQVRVTAAKGVSHAGLMIAQRIGPDNGSVSVVSVPVEAALIPKPAAPRAPELALQASEHGTVSKPLADAVPLSIASPNIVTPNPPAPDTPAPDLSRSGSSAPTDKAHALTPNPPPSTKQAGSEPTVTITNSPTGAGKMESHKKKWILIALGAGAGAAALLGVLAAHGGGGAGGAGSGSSSGVSVGTPTITVGH
jgi:hypothetical protein